MSEAGQRWTSRKLLFSIGTVLLASGLLWAGLIDQETWKHVSSLVVGGYLTMNVLQKATAKTGGQP